MLNKSILEGIIDLHIHAGPSVAKRSVDAAEALQEAEQAGYRAIVIKDHYFPTMMECAIAEKYVGKGVTKCLGGIVLNNAIGLFNLAAIDTALAMGAKIVWFPTLSAQNHLNHHKNGFLGSGSMSVPEQPIYYLDDSGNLTPEVIEVLKYMTKHKDVILATGHGHRTEIDAMVSKAFELGVEKILINHPMWQIEATLDDMIRWANMGAFIEFNVCIYENMKNINTGEQMGPIPFSLFKEYFDCLPLENILIVTDLGQSIFPTPVTGMYNFLSEIHERFGVTEAQINMMTKVNPSKLLAI